MDVRPGPMIGDFKHAIDRGSRTSFPIEAILEHFPEESIQGSVPLGGEDAGGTEQFRRESYGDVLILHRISVTRNLCPDARQGEGAVVGEGRRFQRESGGWRGCRSRGTGRRET